MSDLTLLVKDKMKDDRGFCFANNYNVLYVEENYCEMEAIMDKTSFNPFGIAHGGYIFGLADTAAGIAAMTDGRVAVTIDSSIQYLKAGKGSKLKAVAKCIKNGKNVGFFEVYIYDQDDVLIAKSNINYFYMN